jgi:hypothetical protein
MGGNSPNLVTLLTNQPLDIRLCFFGSATPCASPPPRPSIFSNYSFRVHHLANQDDRHLLAHAIALTLDISLKRGIQPFR